MFFSTKQNRPHSKVSLAGFAVMLACFYFAGAAQAQLPEAQHYGSVEYRTGGFGLDESTALKEAMSDYPLALTFASSDGQSAAYLAQVRVVIRDEHDATVLNVEAQGPYLLVRLPAGKYTVLATYQEDTKSRSVTLNKATTRIVFDWPRSQTDAATTTPASSESSAGSEQIPGVH